MAEKVEKKEKEQGQWMESSKIMVDINYIHNHKHQWSKCTIKWQRLSGWSKKN